MSCGCLMVVRKSFGGCLEFLLTPTIFGQKYSLHVLNKKFIGATFLHPQIIQTKFFFMKILWINNFCDPKSFQDPKFLKTKT